MTTVLLLAVVAAIAGIAASLGTVLFIIGLFKKKRSIIWKSAAIVLVAVLVIICCGAYASFKVVRKIGNADYQGIWRSVVDAAFDDTAVPPDDPAKARQTLGVLLGDTAILQGTDVQGVGVPGVVLSYHYYRYTADEQRLLQVIAAAPADSTWEIASDTACAEITWEAASDDLLNARHPQRNLPDWTPETATDKHCYYCFRAPWQHVLMIDRATGTVYHYIGETRE